MKINQICTDKTEKGITLIALIITIVILIILSVITVNFAFGEGGIIQKAEQSKQLTEQAKIDEQEKLNSLMSDEIWGNDNDDANIDPEPEEPYIDDSIVQEPQIKEGMVPIKWDDTQNKWVKTDETDSEWYNYSEKKWANIVLVGENGVDADGDEQVFNEDGTLNEDSNYSMLVWIPRYAYKITSNYHTNSAGNIEIVFLDTNNKDKNGNDYSSKTTYPTVTGGAMSDFVVHPAFNYNGEPISGFWVGKFETSHTNCTTDSSTGNSNTNTTSLIAQIKAGVTSWRNNNISNIFDVCTSMNDANNLYGLPDDTLADPHLIKNNEWGAIAYLSQNSTYGKGSEIWINNSSSFITGSAGSSASATENLGTTNDYKSEQGQQASTTGNIYGVYDMNGGTMEYVAAYVNNNYVKSGQNYTNGKELIDTVNAGNTKYADVYVMGTTDSDLDSYIAAQPTTGLGIPNSNTGHYGDAIWETSSNSGSGFDYSWYGDHSRFPLADYPFIIRGGDYQEASSAGIFYFVAGSGSGSSNLGFHITITMFG